MECPCCRKTLTHKMLRELARKPHTKVLRCPSCKGVLAGSSSIVDAVYELALKELGADTTGTGNATKRSRRRAGRIKNVVPATMAEATAMDRATREPPWYAPGEVQGGAPGLGTKR